MNYQWMRDRWDRLAAVIAGVVGVIAVFLGWFGVSGSSLTTQQLPYLASGAVGGLFALGVACTLWLSADMRDEFAKLDQIQQLLEEDRFDGPPTPSHGVRAIDPELSSSSNDLRPRTRREPAKSARR